MLRKTPLLKIVRHEIRNRVCRQCFQRPPHSEHLPLDIPRCCEPACPIFKLLPRLYRTAMHLDVILRPLDQTLRDEIDEFCGRRGQIDDRRGAPRGISDTPLKRYRDQVVQVLVEFRGED